MTGRSHRRLFADIRRALSGRRGQTQSSTVTRTATLGALALLSTAAVVISERPRARQAAGVPSPRAEADPLAQVPEGLARQTVDLAVAGYRRSSEAQKELLALVSSFSVAFAGVRALTYLIHARGPCGPIRDLRLGRCHVHHFVPGILIAFLAGGASIVTRNKSLTRWLTVPFGMGVALTLDESALLLKLEDVYWSEEGIVSVQIALGALGALSMLTLALRLLRRHERRSPLVAVG
jgi:hypothetical protein